MKKDPKNKYRVLLMCKKCDKVYNGTGFLPYDKAIAMYYRTLLKNTDVCKNEDCSESLTPVIK